MRIFVCSPLRGPDRQPDPKNIALARSLMLAVFEAGHAPFVPHLLYPQVLSESEAHIKIAFEANYAFLNVCDEIWVWARNLVGCSNGMRKEVGHCELQPVVEIQGVLLRRNIPVRYMPEPYVKVARALRNSDGFGEFGECSECKTRWFLGTSGRCFFCFAGDSGR